MSSPTGSSQWMGNTGSTFYDFEIEKSLTLAGAGALEFTPAEANTSYWTFATWIKRNEISGNYAICLSSTNYANPYQVDGIGFNGDGSTDDEFFAFQFSNSNSAPNGFQTQQYSNDDEKFQDQSSWYHFCVRNNNSTATVWINGQEIQQWSRSSNFRFIGRAGVHNIGAYGGSSRSYSSTNMSFAETYFILDSGFDADDIYDYTQFVETKNGILVPKENSLTAAQIGDGGFYLEYKQVGSNADANGLGADTSGNGHHVAYVGSILDAHRGRPDTPTNNFCTLASEFVFHGADYNPATSAGALEFETSGNATNGYGTHSVNNVAKNGGVYFEVRLDAIDTSRTYIGVICQTGLFPNADGTNGATYAFPKKALINNAIRGFFDARVDGNSTDLTSQGTLANGDVVGVAINSDGKVFFSKNGTFLDNGDGDTGNPSTGANPMVTIDFDDGEWLPVAGYNSDFTVNFGQDGSFEAQETSGGNSDANGIGDFMFAVPTGHLALCTKNMSEPTIGPNSLAGNTSEHFQTLTYTGNGGTQSIAVDHQPDFTWIKNRSSTDDHQLFDSNRGVTKVIETNENTAEAANDDTLTAFISSGFSLGDDVTVNTNAELYAAFNWKANGGTATATISESGNNPAASVQANPNAGFSLITYTGTGAVGTIAHGLGKIPKGIWIKNRDDTDSWACYHHDAVAGDPGAATQYFAFNNNGANTDNANRWNDTSPTSSVFTVATDDSVNKDGEKYVAYVFAEVEGFSKFGSYTANNAADGPYVYLGFRPSFLIVRNAGADANWEITTSVYNKTSGNNPADQHLFPNITSAETSSDAYNMLSNGFKIKSTGYSRNRDTQHYVYYAWAAQPFKYSNGR